MITTSRTCQGLQRKHGWRSKRRRMCKLASRLAWRGSIKKSTDCGGSILATKTHKLNPIWLDDNAPSLDLAAASLWLAHINPAPSKRRRYSVAERRWYLQDRETYKGTATKGLEVVHKKRGFKKANIAMLCHWGWQRRSLVELLVRRVLNCLFSLRSSP